MHQRKATIKWGQCLFISLALLCLCIQQVQATSLEIAEDLLVDLRSEDLVLGPVIQWPNYGSLGGVFRADGDPCVIEAVGDWEAYVVNFDGSSSFEGPDSPSGINGDGTRTIEVWAYNIEESKEECMVAWSHRGGGDGTNMTFNYGWKDFGAAGHWGDDADMAWEGFDNASGGTGGYPDLETWQYLVYTYDGTTVRLYVNGELNNERDVDLDSHSGDPIRIGGQNNSDGSAKNQFSGAIAQVRIHDGVLTPAQILANSEIRILNVGAAYDPSPEASASDVAVRDLELTWSAGEFPGTHTVYFSEELEPVRDGTAVVATGLTTTSYDPGPLSYDTTYYWRVDEVNDSADATVYEGKAWAFTTEPYSVELTGDSISVTASSIGKNSDPNFILDGSGLTDMAHSVEVSDMWVSGDADTSPWLLFEFDQIQKLDQMLVWNSNNDFESFLGLGVKDVNILYSTDGENWETYAESFEILQAPGSDDYNTPQAIDFGLITAKYLKIEIINNWSSTSSYNNTSYSVAEVKIYALRPHARNPIPEEEATDVDPDSTLSWRTGFEATEHHVYLSTDESAVNDGSAPVEIVYDTSYSPALELGNTYYWRVDEVNMDAVPTVWTSQTWSFSTTESIVIEDFETYGDSSPNFVFQTWLDGYGFDADSFFPNGYSGNGTGSIIGHDIWESDFNSVMETDIVNGGLKSMPFYYEGNSQTDVTLDPAQDWTLYGVTTLVIHVYGQTGNTGDLYVKIGNTKIEYSGSVAAEEWVAWEIDLTTSGASLANVSSLSIGIDGSSASGLIYIDDVLIK